jgi:hypothetical protein
MPIVCPDHDAAESGGLDPGNKPSRTMNFINKKTKQYDPHNHDYNPTFERLLPYRPLVYFSC